MSLLTNLLAYYQLDGTALDVTGNGHNGDLSGGGFSYVAGKIGNALLFPGTVRGMSCGPNPGNMSPQAGVAGAAFSIAGWVNPTSFGAAYATILGRNESGVGFYIKPDGHLSLWDFAHGGDHASTGAVVVTGAWQFVAFTFAGASGAYKFYLNGVELGGGASGVAFDFSSTSSWVGGDASNAGPLTGAVDELGVWSRELTLAEIGQLYNGGTGLTYPFTLPPPTVSSVAPAFGTITGGTHVVITGTNFVATPTVSIGGVACTGVVFVSSTTLNAITGAHARGSVNVVVTNPDAQVGTLVGGFAYSTPVITILSPSPGTIGLNTTLAFKIEDFAPFKRIVIEVAFPVNNIKEILYDGVGFGPMYTNSQNTVSAIALGYTFTVLRNGGWITNDGPILTPFAINTLGDENA